MSCLCFYCQHCTQCKAPVLKLLRGRFWVFFHPAVATCCTDGGEIWPRGVELWSGWVDQRHPIDAGWEYGTPKNYLNLTIFWNINALQGCILCMIFYEILTFDEFYRTLCQMRIYGKVLVLRLMRVISYDIKQIASVTITSHLR